MLFFRMFLCFKERDNNSGGKRSKDDDGNKQIMRTTLVSTLLTAEGQVRVWTNTKVKNVAHN